MSAADGSQDWLAAAQQALAESGVEGVRVEVLAQRLGVTKGGFYRRYRDRRDLLDRLLEAWVEGRVAAIQRQSGVEGEPAADRLRGFIRLFSERHNVQGLSIELAIRQWARSDERAAAAVARVDEVRLAIVADLYGQLGYSPAEARARGVILYSFLFGEGLLFLDLDQAAREAMMEACADALVRAR